MASLAAIGPVEARASAGDIVPAGARAAGAVRPSAADDPRTTSGARAIEDEAARRGAPAREDRATISPAAGERAGLGPGDAAQGGAGAKPDGAARKARAAAASSGLDEEDRRVITELAKADASVRAHERAHQAAAGGLAGAASFSYQRGPDGKLYAVAGEVPIALREGRTPDETIEIARKVRAAANAPADPSTQDRAVAAAAASMEARAMTELASERRAEATPTGDAGAATEDAQAGPRAATGARAAAAYAAARPTERPPRVDRVA